jgi:hypothetical protein
MTETMQRGRPKATVRSVLFLIHLAAVIALLLVLRAG